jgi:Uncharacterised nucleotidyltransferase
MNIKIGSFLPTEEQELLLKAALLQGESAINAWEKWHKLADIDNLDAGSYRLLPLLYKNLVKQGVTHPLINRCKGVYRLTWSKNQLLFNQLLPWLSALEQAGIKATLLKGTALVVDYYQDYGLRVMNDIDIFVHKKDVSKIVEISKNLQIFPQPVNSYAQKFSHSITLVNNKGLNIDLHWHILGNYLQYEGDQKLLSRTVKTKFYAQEVDTLNPTDHLFHVCTHGTQWLVLEPIYWIADVIMIINSSSHNIDWEYLLRLIKENQDNLRFKNIFIYLKDRLNANIPDWVLNELKSSSISYRENLTYQAKTGDYEQGKMLPIIWRLVLKYSYYVRVIFRDIYQLNLVGFMKELQKAWKLEHIYQVPLTLIAKLFKMIVVDFLASKNRIFSK